MESYVAQSYTIELYYIGHKWQAIEPDDNIVGSGDSPQEAHRELAERLHGDNIDDTDGSA